MNCVEKFVEIYHSEPEEIAFCPYRICPIGAHVDHQLGKITGLAVRRHLLCPLFATRFVSAFFYRARGGAAARRDGGLKEGGAVYAVSARGPVAAAVFLETFLQDASGSRRIPLPPCLLAVRHASREWKRCHAEA